MFKIRQKRIPSVSKYILAYYIRICQVGFIYINKALQLLRMDFREFDKRGKIISDFFIDKKTFSKINNGECYLTYARKALAFNSASFKS